MKNTKRLAALITALAAVLLLTSCGMDEGGEAADIVTTPEVCAEADAPNGADESAEIGKVFDGKLTPPTLRDDKDEKHDREEVRQMDMDFTDAAFDFSAELFKQSCTDTLCSGENAMVSPWSVMQALGLAANGADGETLEQLEALLGVSLNEMNECLAAMRESAETSEDVRLGIANSVWANADTGFSLKKSYIDACAEKLGAAAYEIPFDQAGADKLNGWVAEKTDDMIQKLIDSFDPYDRAVLINCLVFKGEWAKEYDDLQIDENAIFTNAKGETEDCTMLASTEDRYIAGDGVTGFIKPYRGGRYAFAALLPDEDSTLSELAASLDGERLKALLNSAKNTYAVQAYIPEFKFDFGKSIAKELAAMGIGKAFSDEADFSRMSNEALYIGDVIHKTYIELDRTGTKAAAATGIMFRTMSLEPIKEIVTVRLDRPFMFAVIDTETGLPIFMGTVNSVK